MSEVKLSSNELFSLLGRVKNYIEENESNWTWEVSDCKSADELIAQGRMPQLYNDILKAMGENNQDQQP